MKKILKFAAAFAMMLFVSNSAFAQDAEKESDNWYPHNFISVQGGAQITFTNYKMDKLITPNFALSVGRYFAPQLGARLHLQGYEIKGGYPEVGTYKVKYITGDADLLLNMLNIFNPARASQKFNWNMIVGFGVNHTWDYDDYEACRAKMPYNEYGLYSKRHTTFNGRVGTQIEYNFTRNFGINFEIDGNYKNDRFNQKINNKCDWQLVALAGLTFRFGLPKKKVVEPEPEYIPEPTPEPEPVVEPEPAPAPAPAPVVKEEPLNETIFFTIRQSDPVGASIILDKVVAWCNKYPGKTITIDGYADKGTGNARVNRKYAKLRAERVAKALQDRGIDASRMTVNSHGDTVQPYAENDKNRCTIIIGK
ncbi:MAG: OmpA family protein [Muribaculaceae bacterium]